MQVVDILGDNADPAPLLQTDKGLMGLIGPDMLQLRPALVVKIKNQPRIAGKGLGRGHVFDAVRKP